MHETTIFVRVGLALLLGLLVGLQRERQDQLSIGLRTYTLVTLFGALAGVLAISLGAWIVAAGMIVVGAFAITVLLRTQPDGDEQEPIPHAAGTLALVFMYGVGALLIEGPPAVAVALGGGVAVLLHLKKQLHGLAGRLRNEEVRAVMQLALVSAVILPVLPDKAYGPYDVLNPQHIWLMVTLIVAISLAAYVAFRALGQRAGVILGGLLGGAISSTAATISAANNARASPDAVWWSVVFVMLASAVMYVRAIIEIGIVAPTSFLPDAAAPLGIMAGVTLAIAAIPWVIAGRKQDADPDFANPGQLKTALVFGAVYAAVLFAVAAGRDWLGEAALWPVAALSGLAGVDPIALSTARLVSEGREPAGLAWKLILLATLSNMALKLAIVGALGGVRLLSRTAPFVAGVWIAGAALMFLWPSDSGSGSESGAQPDDFSRSGVAQPLLEDHEIALQRLIPPDAHDVEVVGDAEVQERPRPIVALEAQRLVPLGPRPVDRGVHQLRRDPRPPHLRNHTAQPTEEHVRLQLEPHEETHRVLLDPRHQHQRRPPPVEPTTEVLRRARRLEHRVEQVRERLDVRGVQPIDHHVGHRPRPSSLTRATGTSRPPSTPGSSRPSR